MFVLYLDIMRRITLRLIYSAIGFSVCCILLIFVFSNSDDHIHLKESQSIKYDCSLIQEATPKSIPLIATINPNAIRFATCKDMEKTSPIQRAIIIYYPSHQSEYFFPEVRW
jgi:hypothetical protein